MQMQSALNFSSVKPATSSADFAARGELTRYDLPQEGDISPGLFVRDSSGALEHASMHQILAAASRLLESQFKELPISMDGPGAVKTFLKTKLYGLDHEVFAALFLDVRYRLVKYEVLFRGTLGSCPVYPRELLKACLEHKAAAVILAHNHPSGDVEPSHIDIAITKKIKKLLVEIDVRVVDHIIVGGTDVCSMAEKDLL